MEEKKYEIIGNYTPPNEDGEGEAIERAYFRQGYIYKNPYAYHNELDKVCYIPELSDTTYTRNDFIGMCNEQEDMAEELFEAVDWQHPETLIEDWVVNGEWDNCGSCGKIFNCYDVKNCPHCGAKYEGGE